MFNFDHGYRGYYCTLQCFNVENFSFNVHCLTLTSELRGVVTSSLELLTELEDDDLDRSDDGADDTRFLELLLVLGVPALLGG